MGNIRLFVMIDDDTDDQEIFQMALSELHTSTNCLFFSDCESAVAHFSQQDAVPPGFVFVDLHLPRLTADQCLQQLQKLQEFDNPRIIIYSGAIPDEWRPRLERIGVDQFIQKTGSVSALVGELQHLIEAA